MASDTSMTAALGRLSDVEAMLKGDWTAAGHACGKMAKDEAKAVAATVTNGSGVLRHMGRGARLGAGYDLTNKGATMTLKLRPPGPWVIMEQGARPHKIGPRRGKGHVIFGGAMFGAGRPAIMAPGYSHPVNGPIGHPGMRQKRGAIRKTFTRVRAQASEVYHDAMVKKLGEIYG